MCLPTHTHDHICAIFLRGHVAARSGTETKTQSPAVSSMARASPRTGAGIREEVARTTQLLLPFTAGPQSASFISLQSHFVPFAPPPRHSAPLLSHFIRQMHLAGLSLQAASPGSCPLPAPSPAWPPLLRPLQHSLLTPGLKPHTCSNGQFPCNSPTPKAGCSWIQGLRWTQHLLPSA